MADNLSYFSDDEESEWLANIDPSLFDKSNEEKRLDDGEISSFIEEDRNSNTTKKTKTDLNVWTRWCNSINERRQMEDISPEELNSLLAHFFIKIRKLNGEEFEPGTLTSFQRSFDRYIRQHRKNYNIIQDKIFESSREALESKRKQLRLSGKGGRPNKALGLTNDELESFGARNSLETIRLKLFSVEHHAFRPDFPRQFRSASHTSTSSPGSLILPPPWSERSERTFTPGGGKMRDPRNVNEYPRNSPART